MVQGLHVSAVQHMQMLQQAFVIVSPVPQVVSVQQQMWCSACTALPNASVGPDHTEAFCIPTPTGYVDSINLMRHDQS